jgi:cytoskeletal protein RodZ
MVRTNQGGSVLSFIIIGVVLAALLIGGARILRQQAVQPIVDQPQKASDKPATDAKPQKASEDSDKHSSSSNTQADTSKKDDSVSSSPVATQTLPETGAVSAIGTLIVLGSLSGLVASYMRSRRPELSL